MNETLPAYQVRLSQRAKYARLVMKPNGILEVVLPMGMNHDDAEDLIRSHKDWIAKHQQAVAKPIDRRPSSIYFPSLNQTMFVHYVNHHCDNSFLEDEEGLTVFTREEAYIPKVMQYWLKKFASLHLPKMLLVIAQEMDESYQSVSIRLQKTRWGSCSNQRRINLNAKLLLLPEGLMRYVMVHELSHLQHMNHSQQFWQRVAEFEPEYVEKRQQLRLWSRQAPHWLIIE